MTLFIIFILTEGLFNQLTMRGEKPTTAPLAESSQSFISVRRWLTLGRLTFRQHVTMFPCGPWGSGVKRLFGVCVSHSVLNRGRGLAHANNGGYG